MIGHGQLLTALVLVTAPIASLAETTEFCLEGEFDLGARYQGMLPQAGERYPARWCVTTDDESERVLLSMSGKSNPDMDGSWTVAFIPPNLIRIVNDGPAPDVEFRTQKAAEEAQRARFLDPLPLAKNGAIDDSPLTLRTMADLPLRGRVPVTWRWHATSEAEPRLEIEVDGDVLFLGAGSRRALTAEEAVLLWQPTAGAKPIDVPGERWPAIVDMELVNLTDGVYVVRGVRTGFHHMVIETDDGLVVADAPAGWVELHQFPPVDLVPGLGISGLSERLIDFLATEFPGVPVRAVALTHHHDDHAGGARAFAAVGADVYAPAEVADFLQTALNRSTMPPDRLSAQDGIVQVIPVEGTVTLDDTSHPVRLINLGESPHAISSLGVLAGGIFFQSDLHLFLDTEANPGTGRMLTECWFSTWAIDNLPPDTLVINSHNVFKAPVSRHSLVFKSGAC